MQPKLSIDCAVSVLIQIAEASWSTETYRLLLCTSLLLTPDLFIYI